MNNLEHFFYQNKEFFDEEEPKAGHFGRFNKKLKSYNKKKSYYDLKIVFEIAAVALIVIVAGIATFNYFYNPTKINTNSGISLSEISSEYKEVENYYQSNVDAQLNELNKLKCKNSNIEKSSIYNELKNLNLTYESLKNELRTNGKDERIINAMITNYQMRVGLLKQAIDFLKNNC